MPNGNPYKYKKKKVDKKKRARTKIAISKAKRKVFLENLAMTGQVAVSARAAGYANTKTVLGFRSEDEEFAKAWDEAVAAATHTLEEEAIRRARDGVREPVFYKGRVVGHKLNYSDALLLALLKRNDPTYRETSGGGNTNINFGIAVLPVTAKSDEEWESRAIDMHSHQQVIDVEPQSAEKELIPVNKVKRSD